MQIWMGIFLIAGVLTTFFMSRVYCGWICPINTTIKGTNWIKKKLHIGSFKIPDFLRKPWARIIILTLFLAAIAFTFATGEKLPVLLVLLGLGVLLSVLFPEELWHRYLCPYGTILSVPGSKSKWSLKIDQDACISCGKCKSVCPAVAVENTNTTYEIIKKDCLVCMACVDNCPKDAIPYK